jgi:hypothetical protein
MLPGDSPAPDCRVWVKTDKDSVELSFDHELKPYDQINEVNIITPRFKKTIRYNFRRMRCEFDTTYMNSVKDNPQYEVPEIYELANILYSLTQSSHADQNRIFKETAYYKRVQAYFAPYRKHPLIAQLEFGGDEKGTEDYYNFRENSYCYKLDKGKVVNNGRYYVVWGTLEDNLFEKLRPLVNDFVKKTRFEQFYEQNKSYYDSLIREQRELMPVLSMWHWLEQRSDTRMQSYKVVFSPLIFGSHSTQGFGWIENPKQGFFNEAIMYVSSTEPFNSRQNLTVGQRKGIVSGIVFTEIDHNYCNPISAKYSKQIDSVLSNRSKWITANGDGAIYDTPERVFNEYITHALYVLYCFDHLKNQVDFAYVRQNREKLMVEQRGYIQFGAFDDMLLKLYQSKSGQRIEDLYPAVLVWCAAHNR